MHSTPRILFVLSAIWAVLALMVQARSALRGRQPLHAPAAGSGMRGAIYSFTGAMAPARKESASGHPKSFAAGVLLHLAVFCAFATAAAVAAVGVRWSWSAPVLAIGLLACLGLLVKRIVRADLRVISVPEDFTANAAVAGLLACAFAFSVGAAPASALQLAAAAVLIYLPLGKLRHGLFFFLARADLGRRLGRRGVWPPTADGTRHGRT